MNLIPEPATPHIRRPLFPKGYRGKNMARETIDILLRSTLFLCSAVPATVIDIKLMTIPDFLSLGGLICLATLDMIRSPSALPLNALAAIVAFCLFYIIRLVTGGMGFGDLKFAAFIAFFIGLPYLFAAMTVAAFSAILFFIWATYVFKRERNTKIPFAPFLTGAAVVVGVVELFGLY
jgi:prepilin signal peptidase PulO-like enzyme (type II secretory pathway)